MPPGNRKLNCFHGQAIQRQTQKDGSKAAGIAEAGRQAKQQKYPDMLQAVSNRGHRTMRRRHDVQQRDADA